MGKRTRVRIRIGIGTAAVFAATALAVGGYIGAIGADLTSSSSSPPPPCVPQNHGCEIPTPPNVAPPATPQTLRGAAVAPLFSGTSSNGRLTLDQLSPATGGVAGTYPGQGQLAPAPAAAWNAFSVYAHEQTGSWPGSNGSDSMYRPYAEQVRLRAYWCAQGACQNAAVPGTSNHGIGWAVDTPPATQSLVRSYGGRFGWSFACSDAPWEAWHVKWCGGWSGHDPGPFGNGSNAYRALKLGDGGRRVFHLNCVYRHLHRPPHGPSYTRHRSRHFGPGMKRATESFQRDHDLDVDGIVGAKTHERIASRWHRWAKQHPPACG